MSFLDIGMGVSDDANKDIHIAKPSCAKGEYRRQVVSVNGVRVMISLRAPCRH